MRALQSNKVFFSAYQDGRTLEQNIEAHDDLKETLDNIGAVYGVVTGFYKGRSELTIMLESSIIGQHEANVLLALDLAKENGQESVLEVHNDGTAVLHDAQGRPHPRKVGQFRETTELDALTRDSYTLVRATGRYFVID